MNQAQEAETAKLLATLELVRSLKITASFLARHFDAAVQELSDRETALAMQVNPVVRDARQQRMHLEACDG